MNIFPKLYFFQVQGQAVIKGRNPIRDKPADFRVCACLCVYVCVWGGGGKGGGIMVKQYLPSPESLSFYIQ